MLWLPIILLLGQHNGMKADADTEHDNWRNRDQIRTSVDETNKQNGMEAIEKHETWKAMKKITNQINETDQKNVIKVAEQQTIWQEIDLIKTPDEADRRNENNGVEGHESGREADGIKVPLDKTDRNRRDTKSIPDGTIQTLQERGLLRGLSLATCFGGNRDQIKTPRYTESRCERCCSKYKTPTTARTVGADSNLAAISKTGQHNGGQGIQRSNRRVKVRHTSTSRDAGVAVFLFLMTALVCCGCLCDNN